MVPYTRWVLAACQKVADEHLLPLPRAARARLLRSGVGVHKLSLMTFGAASGLLLLAGCQQSPPRAIAIGEAFVGPATLNIRSDFPLQASTVAVVRHGDRLEILQVRRKFLRVRTARGAEGWTDERQLLAASDMAALRELAGRTAAMPSQGVATTFSTLNIHTQPVLSSPSFVQLKEGDKVDVLRSVLFPRGDAPPRTPLIPPMPKRKKAEPRKREKKVTKIPPPPMPRPPVLPEDWLDLSRTDSGDDEAAAAETPEPDQPAPKVDGWSLVRTPQGRSGWVLTRMLFMAIPDEVAQYAEGRRIVSYFPLGEMDDDGQKHKVWLWTTTSNSRQAWDFDSFRVFVWSMRRHRYETAHIERNIKGYSPVLLRPVNYSARGESSTYPGFSVCMENKAGERMRREYVLMTNLVRFASEQPCEPPLAPLEVRSPAPLPVTAAPAVPPKEGAWESLKRRWKAWRKK
jgi:hypothetical protein